MRETIPDPSTIVRFLLKSEYVVYNGRIIVSMHAFYDPSLSVDWMDRTTLDEAYARKPKSAAHAKFVAGAIRSIGDESVQHKPESDNYSHSEVICTATLEGGKRPKPACQAFMMSVAEAGLKPVASAEDVPPNEVDGASAAPTPT